MNREHGIENIAENQTQTLKLCPTECKEIISERQKSEEDCTDHLFFAHLRSFSSRWEKRTFFEIARDNAAIVL